MVRRALAAVLLLTCAGCARAEPVPLRVGAAVPAAWRPSGPAPRLHLVWIARTRDCLVCQELDFELRRVQSRFRGEVPLVAIHVGSRRDAGVPRAFLRGRRVDAEVRTISPRAFRRLHGDAGVPSLHLVHGGWLVWTSALRLGPGAPRVRLDTLVARHRDGDLQAIQVQFWLTNEGDGWDCTGCCFTGYCCTIPIDACQQEPT